MLACATVRSAALQRIEAHRNAREAWDTEFHKLAAVVEGVTSPSAQQLKSPLELAGSPTNDAQQRERSAYEMHTATQRVKIQRAEDHALAKEELIKANAELESMKSIKPRATTRTPATHSALSVAERKLRAMREERDRAALARKHITSEMSTYYPDLFSDTSGSLLSPTDLQ